MKYLDSYLSKSIEDKMNLLKDLSTDLMDEGLNISISYNDGKHGSNSKGIYLTAKDSDKKFCKNYPEDQMDWLSSKKPIEDFIKRLETYNLIREENYIIFGGGISVTFYFPDRIIKKDNKKIKLYEDFSSKDDYEESYKIIQDTFIDLKDDLENVKVSLIEYDEDAPIICVVVQRVDIETKIGLDHIFDLIESKIDYLKNQGIDVLNIKLSTLGNIDNGFVNDINKFKTDKYYQHYLNNTNQISISFTRK